MELGLVVLALTGVHLYQTWSLVEAGVAAPAFTLPTLGGEARPLFAGSGRKTLVVFWAPWCGVCGAVEDNVGAIHASGDVDVVSVALSYEDRASVEAFVAEHGVSHPVLLGDRAVTDAYQVEVFPTFYVIDGAGRVEHTVVGYTTEAGLRARLW